MSSQGKSASAPAQYTQYPEQDLGKGIIKRMRKQKCWFFKQEGIDRFGQDIFCPAVLIDCRWDDYVDYRITQMARIEDARATVYVDREVEVGDVLMLAASDATASSTPPTIDTESQVREFKVIPNLKNTARLYIAML